MESTSSEMTAHVSMRRRGIMTVHRLVKRGAAGRRRLHHGSRRNGAVEVLLSRAALLAAAAAAPTAPAAAAAAARVIAADVRRVDPGQLGVGIAEVGARGPGGVDGLVVRGVADPLLEDGRAIGGASNPGHETDGGGLLLGELLVGGPPLGRGATDVVRVDGAVSRRHDCGGSCD